MTANLVNFPPSTTPGYPCVTNKVSIQDAATATISSTWIDSTAQVNVQGWNDALAHIAYVKGSETTVQIRFQVSSDGGLTWSNVGYKVIQASAVAEVTKDILSLTPGNYDASDTVTVSVRVAGYQQLKAQFRGQGGSAPGTVAISVAGSKLVTVG